MSARVAKGRVAKASASIPADAVRAAAEILVRARLPLVWGLVNSTVEAQREAVRLADLLGGIVDSAASPGHRGSRSAFERQGLVTASLGEVMRRANLVVFWGCDPDRAHAGFVERYCPPRPGRLRIAVDVGETRGPSAAEERLHVPTHREIESLAALRAFVRGRRVESDRALALGLPLEPLRGLARQMATCGYGAFVADADPPPERRDPERAGAFGALVRDARSRARLRLVGIRMPGNAVGAENVLTWQTGFPGPVAFGPPGPRYAPGELEGEHVLSRGEVDAALVVGAEPERFLSPTAQEGLRRLPTVFVGASEVRWGATHIAIAAAPFAETDGHVFRMDGVAMRQRPSTATSAGGGAARGSLPTEAAVLKALADAVSDLARRPATS